MSSDISNISVSHLEYKPMRRWEFKTSELSTQQKREARALLFGCFGQKKEFFTGQPVQPNLLHVGVYDIHHLTEGPGRNFLPNMVLAYHGPNANAGKPGIQRRDRNRKPTTPIDATTQLRELVPYSEGSAEMKANAEAEPVYRGWLLNKLFDVKVVTKEEAIWSGAERVGVSGQATRDYLKKLCSAEGPLREVPGAKPKAVEFKPEKKREFGF